MLRKSLFPLILAVMAVLPAAAQVGDFRKDFAVGFNGGVAMSKVSFVPTVPQAMLNGPTFGITARYTCEKYFSSICAVVAELNYAQMGWKENILDMDDQPVPSTPIPPRRSAMPGKSAMCRCHCSHGWGGDGSAADSSSSYRPAPRWASA